MQNLERTQNKNNSHQNKWVAWRRNIHSVVVRTFHIFSIYCTMFSKDEKSEGINKYKGNPFIRDYHIWDRECPIWDRCKVGIAISLGINVACRMAKNQIILYFVIAILPYIFRLFIFCVITLDTKIRNSFSYYLLL